MKDTPTSRVTALTELELAEMRKQALAGVSMYRLARGQALPGEPAEFNTGYLRRRLLVDKRFEAAFKEAQAAGKAKPPVEKKGVEYWRAKAEGLVGQLADRIEAGEKVNLLEVVREEAKKGRVIHHPHLWNWVQRAQGKAGRRTGKHKSPDVDWHEPTVLDLYPELAVQ